MLAIKKRNNERMSVESNHMSSMTGGGGGGSTMQSSRMSKQVESDIDFQNRPKQGKFEMIFPFNKTSEDLAIALNKYSNMSAGSSNHNLLMAGPNYMKLLI
jgi:hypothetical protein